MKTPCLITVDKGVNVPRLPSYKRRVSMQEYKIPMVTLKDLNDQDKTHYGLNGSPTQVEEIFPPSSDVNSITIEQNPTKAAQAFMDVLKDRKVL